MDINQKAQEFRANAEACKIEPTRPLMDSYVTNSIRPDGTSTIDGGKILSQKDAACMKIPGAAYDDPSMVSRFSSWVDSNLASAQQKFGSTLNEVKSLANSAADGAKSISQVVSDPQGTIKSAQQGYDNALGSGKIERAMNATIPALPRAP